MAANNDAAVVFRYSLLQDGGGDADQRDAASQHRTALGRAAWLDAFWFPTQQRKHPHYKFQVDDQTTISIAVNSAANNNDTSSTSSKETDWTKLVQSALKKIIVEDLGDLAAQELWENIPTEDSDGRGRNDLEQLEKQLSVKVVFLEKHILLVGAKAKLEKKCLVIRNVLSHYYWRLKGKQINL
ncbi:expressed unknown protein [Seminavis robusta]|uniref:Uncharacterized protein n=1 Tax=Seminavis robusta TaxID=568900 RepID=A0A9N8DSY4_9STRA|nr:expressed unknown protein [Seminavis robusta]|eukprot:Sro266_g103080.1 n/a (184) ;mRNA; r:24850-25401